jgi:hypothetical protein
MFPSKVASVKIIHALIVLPGTVAGRNGPHRHNLFTHVNPMPYSDEVGCRWHFMAVRKFSYSPTPFIRAALVKYAEHTAWRTLSLK